ncbi:hypothetical protein RYX36_004947 [Vicia faba]
MFPTVLQGRSRSGCAVFDGRRMKQRQMEEWLVRSCGGDGFGSSVPSEMTLYGCIGGIATVSGWGGIT